MTDPRRWFNDPSVPAAYRRMLAAATPPPPMAPEFDAGFSSFTAKLAAPGLLGKLAAGPSIAKLLVVSATLGAATVAGFVISGPRLAASSVGTAEVLRQETSEYPDAITDPSPPRAGSAESLALAKPETVDSPAVESVANSPKSLVRPSGSAPLAAASGSWGQPTAKSAATTVANSPESLALVTDKPAKVPMANSPESLALVTDKPVPRSSGPRRDVSIRDEAVVLEQARRSLADSPQRAIRLADEHAERFRGGYLAAERELIAVQALVNLGRQGEAKQRAQRFFNAYSSSVYQRRMRQVLGEAIP